MTGMSQKLQPTAPGPFWALTLMLAGIAAGLWAGADLIGSAIQ